MSIDLYCYSNDNIEGQKVFKYPNKQNIHHQKIRILFN